MGHQALSNLRLNEAVLGCMLFQFSSNLVHDQEVRCRSNLRCERCLQTIICITQGSNLLQSCLQSDQDRVGAISLNQQFNQKSQMWPKDTKALTKSVSVKMKSNFLRVLLLSLLLLILDIHAATKTQTALMLENETATQFTVKALASRYCGDTAQSCGEDSIFFVGSWINSNYRNSYTRLTLFLGKLDGFGQNPQIIQHFRFADIPDLNAIVELTVSKDFFAVLIHSSGSGSSALGVLIDRSKTSNNVQFKSISLPLTMHSERSYLSLATTAVHGAAYIGIIQKKVASFSFSIAGMAAQTGSATAVNKSFHFTMSLGSYSYCFSCCLASYRSPDSSAPYFLIGGWSLELSEAALWFWKADATSHSLQYRFGLSCLGIDVRLYYVDAVDISAATNHAAILRNTVSEPRKLVLVRSFQSEIAFPIALVKTFDEDIAFAWVQISEKATNSDIDNVTYFARTASAQKQYLMISSLKSDGTYDLITYEMGFADSIDINLFNIVSFATLSTNEGAIFAGNFKSYADKFGTTTSTPNKGGVFFSGFEGLNSKHEYTNTSFATTTSFGYQSCVSFNPAGVNGDIWRQTSSDPYKLPEDGNTNSKIDSSIVSAFSNGSQYVFAQQVAPCAIQSISVGSALTVNYSLNSGTFQQDFEFTILPDPTTMPALCGTRVLTYSARQVLPSGVTSIILPSFVTFDAAQKRMSISTNNHNDVSSSTIIEVLGTLGDLQGKKRITINVANDCASQAAFTFQSTTFPSAYTFLAGGPVGPAPDYKYIGGSNDQTFDIIFTENARNCPATSFLFISNPVGSALRTINAAEQRLFRIKNPNTSQEFYDSSYTTPSQQVEVLNSGAADLVGSTMQLYLFKAWSGGFVKRLLSEITISHACSVIPNVGAKAILSRMQVALGFTQLFDYVPGSISWTNKPTFCDPVVVSAQFQGPCSQYNLPLSSSAIQQLQTAVTIENSKLKVAYSHSAIVDVSQNVGCYEYNLVTVWGSYANDKQESFQILVTHYCDLASTTTGGAVFTVEPSAVATRDLQTLNVSIVDVETVITLPNQQTQATQNGQFVTFSSPYDGCGPLKLMARSYDANNSTSFIPEIYAEVSSTSATSNKPWMTFTANLGSTTASARNWDFKIAPKDQSDIGSYKLEFAFGFENWPSAALTSAYRLELNVMETSQKTEFQNQTANTAPVYQPEPKDDLVAPIGEAFEHSFGEPFDQEGDSVTVKVTLGDASQFALFEEFTNTIKIAAGATNERSPRFNPIKIELTDDRDSNSTLTTTYNLNLVLEDAPAEKSDNATIVSGFNITEPQDTQIEFQGLVGTKEEITQKLEETEKVLEQKFEQRVFDLRSTTINDIYGNKLKQSQFKKFNVFQGFNFHSFNLTDQMELSSAEGQSEAAQPERIELPRPKVEKLTTDGKLGISFSRPIKVPEKYRKIQNSEVALRWLTAQGNVESRKETYLTGEGQVDFEIRPALDLKVVPAEEGVKPEQIDFEWDFKSFTESSVDFQLRFNAPEMLSQDPLDTDNMQMTFWASDFFATEDGLSVPAGETLEIPIIRQTDPGSAQRYERLASIFGSIVLSLLIIGFFLATWNEADTLSLWACYDTLLLIGHLSLLNISMPGPIVIFLTTLVKVLNFEFVPLEEAIIDLLRQKGMNENLGILFFQSGFESAFILVNMLRTLLLLIVILLVGLFASYLDSRQRCQMRKRQPNGRTHIHDRTLAQTVMNVGLRLLLSSFLSSCVSICINFKAGSTGGSFQDANLAITWIIALLLFVVPIAFAGFICRKAYKHEPGDEPGPSYDTIFLGLRWKKAKGASFVYVALFALRRVLFAVVVVYLQEHPVQQMEAIAVSSLAMTCFMVRFRPFEMTHNQFVQLLNEVIFFCTCMVLLSFSPAFGLKPEDKEQIGYLVPYFVFLVATVNLLLLLHATWWQILFFDNRRENYKVALLKHENAEKLKQHVAAQKRADSIKIVDRGDQNNDAEYDDESGEESQEENAAPVTVGPSSGEVALGSRIRDVLAGHQDVFGGGEDDDAFNISLQDAHLHKGKLMRIDEAHENFESESEGGSKQTEGLGNTGVLKKEGKGSIFDYKSLGAGKGRKGGKGEVQSMEMSLIQDETPSKLYMTGVNDITADGLFDESHDDSMLRGPGPPLRDEPWQHTSSGRSDLNDASKRTFALLNGMSTDKSVDVTHEDNEVLDQPINLSIFDQQRERMFDDEQPPPQTGNNFQGAANSSRNTDQANELKKERSNITSITDLIDRELALQHEQDKQQQVGSSNGKDSANQSFGLDGEEEAEEQKSQGTISKVDRKYLNRAHRRNKSGRSDLPFQMELSEETRKELGFQ